MKTLVIGGTGTVGSQVVRELLARGVDVHVLTRNVKARVAPAGVRYIEGDIGNPDTARSAFRGIDAVFMLNGLGATETHEGLMGVSGAKAAGVRRFVYLTVHRLGAEQAYIPHFGSKLAVEEAARRSFAEWTLIQPNNFFQNDLWFKDAILEYGAYPQPIGARGLSRVDVRDIAEAAAIALTEDGHAGKSYALAGPDCLTGEQVASTWSAALGRPVAYAGDDLERWEQTFKAYLPLALLYDFRLMYEWFQNNGLAATREELEQLTSLLGHPPRSFAAYAAETASQWSREAESSVALA